jgi:hypothetical protein
MHFRKLVALGLTAAALAVAALFAAQAGARPAFMTVTLQTSQSEFSPGVLNNGWWDDTGIHTPNGNYIVGQLGPVFRDFFTFDASLLSGCARAAKLQIPRGDGSGDIGGAATGAFFELHDVTTDLLTLNTGTGPDTAIFDDLGSGASYGGRFLPTGAPYAADSFVITLNTAAVHDLNAAFLNSDFFSIGGMITGEPFFTFLFGGTPVFTPTDVARPVNLIVTVGPCTPTS